ALAGIGAMRRAVTADCVPKKDRAIREFNAGEDSCKLLPARNRPCRNGDDQHSPETHAALREMNITPHVAQNDSLTKTGKHRSSAIDGRTTRHIGYRISQSCRAMSECIFGASSTAPCARPSTAVLPSWVPISCSISSPTISCASPSSSPLEAGACPKTPNRTQSPSENPTKQQEQLQSSMFFSRLLDQNEDRPGNCYC